MVTRVANSCVANDGRSPFRARSELRTSDVRDGPSPVGLAVSQLTYVTRGLIRLSGADPHLHRRTSSRTCSMTVLPSSKGCEIAFVRMAASSMLKSHLDDAVDTGFRCRVYRLQMHSRRLRQFIGTVDSCKILQLAAPGFRI